MQGRQFQIDKLEISWENFGNSESAKSLKIFSENNQKADVELDMFYTDEICIALNACFEKTEPNWQKVIEELRKKDGNDYQAAANKIETALAVAKMDEAEYQPMEVIGTSTSFSRNRNILYRINGNSLVDPVARRYNRIMLIICAAAVASLLAAIVGSISADDKETSKKVALGLLAASAGEFLLVGLLYLLKKIVGCCETLNEARERASQGEMLESLDPEAGSSLGMN